MDVTITENLKINIDNEMWCCNKCGHELISAHKPYKWGCLIYERDLQEIYPSTNNGERYSHSPDPDWCSLLEFYCPSCAAMIEVEYLPPGHPITNDIEIDIHSLKEKYLK